MIRGFHWLGVRAPYARGCASVITLASLSALMLASSSHAQTVTASVNVNGTLAVVPEYGYGIHASVYDNSLSHIDTPGSSHDDSFDLLPGRLNEAGVDVLRYPGGGYADVFHFSLARPSWESGITGSGLSPFWGQPGSYGYVAPRTDFGQFVGLLDATNSKAVITVNTGSAIKYDSPTQLGIPTHNGQPQEAAAWVAYANADPAIYGTPNDIALGIDAEGNNWKTAGYWAKLRASTPSEFSTWANAGGVYDSRNAFLAINRDAPVGIKYWEVGNENFGTGYYGGAANQTGYALNYAAPYDGSPRDDNPLLSPAAYGQEVHAFSAAMRAVDPSIKIGAVLATPPDDYSWSYADLNDNGVKNAGENYWNDEVLSQVDGQGRTVADSADFVIVHWYPSGNAAEIVNLPRTKIPRMIHGTTPGLDTGSNAGLRDSIAAWRDDGNAGALEIFVTETDGGLSSGGTEAADGLFAADMYVTFFENGVSNVDWLELHHGGFLSENTNIPNYAFWGIQSVNKLAAVGDSLVPTTTNESDVRIHAAVQDDGTVGVMVLNMNTTGSRTANVSINGAPLQSNGIRWQTDGDTALAQTALATLGNAFSTTVAAQTMQLFLLTPAPSIPGDFDFDGHVDGDDLAVWRSAFGASAAGDADGDRDTDAADFLVWQRQLGAGGATAAVPEPSTIAMGITLLGIFASRRRRPSSNDR
jgi:hypothetical protein